MDKSPADGIVRSPEHETIIPVVYRIVLLEMMLKIDEKLGKRINQGVLFGCKNPLKNKHKL